MKVKKGDTVLVIAGKDKGKDGKVLAALPRINKVIVEGVNRVKKHTRIGQGERGATTGGIITSEAPIHISNVMLIVEADGDKTTSRVGFRRDEVTKSRPDGTTYAAHRSVRISTKTGKEI